MTAVSIAGTDLTVDMSAHDECLRTAGGDSSRCLATVVLLHIDTPFPWQYQTTCKQNVTGVFYRTKGREVIQFLLF